MTDDERLAMLVHLSTKLVAFAERLAELEADVAHLKVCALRPPLTSSWSPWHPRGHDPCRLRWPGTTARRRCGQ